MSEINEAGIAAAAQAISTYRRGTVVLPPKPYHEELARNAVTAYLAACPEQPRVSVKDAERMAEGILSVYDLKKKPKSATGLFSSPAELIVAMILDIATGQPDTGRDANG